MKQRVFEVVGLFVLLSIPQCVAIDQLRLTLLNPDEVKMSLSVVDRIVGVPSETMAWPGGSLQLVSLPILLAKWFWESGFKVDASSVVTLLSEAYLHPWGVVAVLRHVVAAVVSLGFAMWSCLYFGGPTSTRTMVLVGIAGLTLPTIWIQSIMATPDAFGLGLCAIAISCPRIVSGRGGAILAGALTGLAVAAKITMVVLVPLAAVLATQSLRPRGKAAAVFALSFAAGFLVACPYLWTDPLRLGKSIAGNLLRPGAPAGLGSVARVLTEVLSPTLVVASLSGFIFGVRRNGGGGGSRASPPVRSHCCWSARSGPECSMKGI